jgi:phenazine biosynthesis protein phzE
MGKDRVQLLIGEVSEAATLTGIELPVGGHGPQVLAVLPYRQLAERNLRCVDDEVPLLVLRVAEHAMLPRADVLAHIADAPIRLAGGCFTIDDAEYAEIVRRVVADEIGTGEGANFVIKRSYVADIVDYHLAHALSVFRSLCEQESGAYWTFIVHTGRRTFVGATPERHLSLEHGVATMNPISGTYRYPPTGPTLEGVLAFLADGKETDELHMVLDEELKMMSRICEPGVRVVGPYLKEMAWLAHTEYLIEGRSCIDPRKMLRETMFAPTVTGSPLESACRVISRYETGGRGYYSGAIAVLGADDRGGHTLDSAIIIRTMDIDSAGHLEIGVGSTLVRHSDPVSEVAETRAKLAGLLSALDRRIGRLGEHSAVGAALGRHSTQLGHYWISGAGADGPRPNAGKRVLIVDNEDTFTSMLDHQLRSLGLLVTTRRFDEEYSWDGADLVVLGPGPGDPRDTEHPKIARLDAAVAALLEQRLPFVAVCLSHQVLSRNLGLPIRRCPVPAQGMRREIDLFGRREAVGFYNTFAAWTSEDKIDLPGLGPVEISRNAGTDEVYALRGPRFASMQFHVESVLTSDGLRILGGVVNGVLGR